VAETGFCRQKPNPDSDGGYIGIYTPKSFQVDFLWGKNDVRTAAEHEY